MEEKQNKEEKTTNFKAVQNPNSYKTDYNASKTSNKIGFGRGFLLPFFSGVLGCAVVVGTCFGIPSIRSKILNEDISSSNTSGSQNSRICTANFII